MHNITKYFIENFSNLAKVAINKDIASQISQLNREHREELRSRLFKESEKMAGAYPCKQIINWLEDCFTLIDKYSFRFNKVYFSPGTDIKESIYKLLKESKSSVYLCVFTITDDRLASEIVNCHKRGLKVKLITDDEKTHAKGSEILMLKKEGVAIKIDHSKYHMHNKFGIIDGRIALTGSFNWTYTATKHNQENLLTTSNFDIVRQYQCEFNRLWDEMFYFDSYLKK